MAVEMKMPMRIINNSIDGLRKRSFKFSARKFVSRNFSTLSYTRLPAQPDSYLPRARCLSIIYRTMFFFFSPSLLILVLDLGVKTIFREKNVLHRLFMSSLGKNSCAHTIAATPLEFNRIHKSRRVKIVLRKLTRMALK